MRVCTRGVSEAPFGVGARVSREVGVGVAVEVAVAVAVEVEVEVEVGKSNVV
jgi:hypothetical protein